VLEVDCRVPPGHGRATAERRVAEVLGDLDGAVRIEYMEEVVGNASPVASPLMDALRDWIAAEEPGAEVLPTILPGFTDSRTFRAAFPECVAYGFFPQRHQTFYETWPLYHSADERIDVRDLEWATRCYADVTKRILG
jgi:acetylornithine deacetylase/succinyl-diaminopimelate desuccinylase-like protein